MTPGAFKSEKVERQRVRAFILNGDFHHWEVFPPPGLPDWSPMVIFTIGRRFVMMTSACGHLSLMVIFTIREAEGIRVMGCVAMAKHDDMRTPLRLSAVPGSVDTGN